MGKWSANLISYVFHPIIYPPLLLVFYLMSNPVDFGLSDPFEDMILVIQTLINCTILPLAAIVVMWKVKLISSIRMENKMERVGPYIAVMVFFIWYYLSVDLYGIAPVFRLYILGGIVSLFAIFVINIFMKASLHAMGAAGIVTNLVISRLEFGYHLLIFPVGNSYYQIDYATILIVALLIMFIVLLSVFYLRKHSVNELSGGLLLGIFGQILALKLICFI